MCKHSSFKICLNKYLKNSYVENIFIKYYLLYFNKFKIIDNTTIIRVILDLVV